VNKRLFIAIPYVPTQEVLSVVGHLKNATINDKINWVQPENMHLTLKFLGDTDVTQIPIINNGLSGISSKYETFDLRVSGFEMFYRGKHPSVLYLNLEVNHVLEAVAKEVNDLCGNLKIGDNSHAFKAHITVARIKYMHLSEGFLNKQKTKIDQSFRVDGIKLIESRLTSSGPIYEVVEGFELRII
jgi:2'-5' RNA ligase